MHRRYNYVKEYSYTTLVIAIPTLEKYENIYICGLLNGISHKANYIRLHNSLRYQYFRSFHPNFPIVDNENQ